MPKKNIDIVSGGTTAAQQIVVEDATGTDVGAFAPARALQVSGSLLSKNNPIPTSRLVVPGTHTAASGNTSNVLGTVTAVLTANANRTSWYIENNSLATMVIHRGAPGSSTAFMNLYPGQRESRSKDSESWSNLDEGAISVACPTEVTQNYYAGEITKTP